ncbi:MAG TPA: HdeD family acid-resistance protein [Geobacterales bacterium]|nr:HdeD family acid-resistance protein [Geobacterales bacterium]
MTSQASSSVTVIAFPQLVARNWWLFLLRGFAAITFGVLSLIWPGISLVTLILLFGAYALVDGVFALAAAIVGRGNAELRWWLVLVGLLGVGIGITIFLWPGLTALTLLYFIAGWIVATGLLQVIGAIELRKAIENEWWLILDGILSVLFGVLLFIMPGAGAVALIWLVAVFAIAFGILMVGFAFKVKNFEKA